MKIQRKFTSFILVIAMIASMFTTFTMSVSASSAALITAPPTYSTNAASRHGVLPGTLSSLTLNITRGTLPANINEAVTWHVTSDTSVTTAEQIAQNTTAAAKVLTVTNASVTALNNTAPVGAYRAVAKIILSGTGTGSLTEAQKTVYTRIVDITVSQTLNGQATITSASLPARNATAAIPATGTSPAVPAQPAAVAATLALGDETLKGAALDNFTVRSYSINNGARWINVKGTGIPANGDNSLSTLLPRLLNKALTLRISDQPIDRATKAPARGGTTIIFPAISARPKAQKYVVNYAIGSLTATATDVANNRWALTARGATTALSNDVLKNIEIGRLVDKERTPITNGWTKYDYATPTALREVVTIENSEGARNQSWAWRQAPSVNASGGLVPASNAVRIRVLIEQRAPRLRLRTNNKDGGGSLKYRANTTIDNAGTVTTYTTAGELTFTAGSNVNLKIRLAATARRPRSAIQELTGEMPQAPSAN